MPIVVTRGNELYSIVRETFSKSHVYNFSTRHAINVDLFVRVNKEKKFSEVDFLRDVIDLFNATKYPSKGDVRTIARKYGLIIDGMNYSQMPHEIVDLVEHALNENCKVEYAYNALNIAKRGLLVEFKNYDPNLEIFTKVFLNVNGRKKKWVGRDIAENYDKILGEIKRSISECT